MTCDSVMKPRKTRESPARHGGGPSFRSPVLSVRWMAVIFIGATGAFLAIAAGVTAGGPAGSLDHAVATWFHTHRMPGFTTAMRLATGLGSTGWVTGVALTAALLLTWWRRWGGLIAFSATVAGGMVLNAFLKTAFHSPRSGPETWSSSFPGYGFPSGHTMAAALLYGALAACAFEVIATWRVRAGAVFAAVALAGLVGFSRLALGAHYLSDVVGAATASLAWLTLCFTTTDAMRRIFAHGHP